MVDVNGRTYRLPETKTAVICLDGVDPDYLDDAFARGLTPRLRELHYLTGRSQLPSFTNPNNLSIVTGAPPSVHGVPGNHYRASDGSEVQLDAPELLRAPSIHAAFGASGVPVLAVTTKEKLRRLLGAGNVPCVSAELADEQSLPGLEGSAADTVVRPKPGIYDWDCSHYALELGLALSERLDVKLLYVSLTDFVQHSAAPGDELSDLYLARLDELAGSYLDDGWRLGLVADHGMNAKPRIRYLGDLLNGDAQVVLPITDPYVVHHASLGSCCWVYTDDADAVAYALGEIEGVEEVLDREDAARLLQLPADRIGDLVVLGDESTVFGKRRADHDLGHLHRTLRSHGGRHEQEIPLLFSEPVTTNGRPTNADVHWLLLGEAA
jgi:phosphonoacetate hydrolase